MTDRNPTDRELTAARLLYTNSSLSESDLPESCVDSDAAFLDTEWLPLTRDHGILYKILQLFMMQECQMPVDYLLELSNKNDLKVAAECLAIAYAGEFHQGDDQ